MKFWALTIFKTPSHMSILFQEKNCKLRIVMAEFVFLTAFGPLFGFCVFLWVCMALPAFLTWFSMSTLEPYPLTSRQHDTLLYCSTLTTFLSTLQDSTIIERRKKQFMMENNKRCFSPKDRNLQDYYPSWDHIENGESMLRLVQMSNFSKSTE